VVALYGRERVADLEMRAVIEDGVDPAIEETGLQFQIATRLTSWLAIDEARTTTGPGRHESIPQELPYGTSAESFGLRPAAFGAQHEGGLVTGAFTGAAVRRKQLYGYAQSTPNASYPQSIGGGPPPQAMAQLAYPARPSKPAIASGELMVRPMPTRKSSRTWVWLVMVLIAALIVALTWWLAF
jgi:Ca-activated chloride channel family protein